MAQEVPLRPAWLAAERTVAARRALTKRRQGVGVLARRSPPAVPISSAHVKFGIWASSASAMLVDAFRQRFRRRNAADGCGFGACMAVVSGDPGDRERGIVSSTRPRSRVPRQHETSDIHARHAPAITHRWQLAADTGVGVF